MRSTVLVRQTIDKTNRNLLHTSQNTLDLSGNEGMANEGRHGYNKTKFCRYQSFGNPA